MGLAQEANKLLARAQGDPSKSQECLDAAAKLDTADADPQDARTVADVCESLAMMADAQRFIEAHPA